MSGSSLRVSLLVAGCLLGACGSDKFKEADPPGGATGSTTVSSSQTAPVTPATQSYSVPENIKRLQAADVTRVVSTAQNELPPLTPGDYVVSGDKRFNNWFLSAERIVFEPGARLIFSKDAIAARGNLFILAREIVSKDQERPGQIVWEAPPDPGAPGQAGTATPGENRDDSGGTPGGRGDDGAIGAEGERGHDGPNLTIITLKLQSPLLVDLHGTRGGPGAQGQHGGPGGAGGYGSAAFQNAVNCIRPAGNGAPGGPGGDGGQGGPGGMGGNGGVLTLVVPDADVALATRYIKTNLRPGDGGTGGAGGNPGAGGPGGSEGAQQLPYCRGDGKAGPSGPVGQQGSQGDGASKGRDGEFFVGSITPDVFSKVSKR
jgi:hypothetical protein